MPSGENDEVVPIRNVRSTTLKKVIEFCEYHHDKPIAHIEKPLKSTNFSEYVCDWDDDFLNVDKEVVLELIQAANYLDIKPLLDISCAKVASLIKGKTPEEIRKLFDIVNDFTPEEEKQVRDENKWCEDSVI
ncbi:putative suppressor of kinetochore protein 1 [Cardiosporidium cionae]|uniref:Suppressor of kinetochore protein 1 n=1 Tax=Cardiosporidium cionae TaxID=476202 RepID=A0ABQ7JDH8_9APIC|nr:putative suppressor of kinetochore protein 1 [Cardiosporidium cionae]|eukprot:KAF8822067.1 putative suppressor of kinetochore protein 1 [Cardiosporidium cionae]